MQRPTRLQGAGVGKLRRLATAPGPTRALGKQRHLGAWRATGRNGESSGGHRRFLAMAPGAAQGGKSIITQAGATITTQTKPWASSGKQGTTLAPTGPRRTSTPDDAIPLVLRNGAVVSDSRGVVLDALPSYATAASDVSSDHGGLVLGFRSAEGPTSLVDLCVGQVKVGRILACARCKLWWMTPEWRNSTLQLPPETQFMLAELASAPEGSQDVAGDGQAGYLLMLPLIESNFRATLRAGSEREGRVTIRIESGDKNVKRDAWGSILYMAAGTDPYKLIDRGVAAAAALSGGAQPLSNKRLPPSLDVFGWCTWDAFYSTVSARGIAEGLSSLHKGGIRPRTLIIDDGWQTTDVDPDFRKAPASGLAEQLRLNLSEPEQQLLQSTEQAFYDESMEILAETVSERLPAGTGSGTVMPGLTNLGPGAMRHHHPHTSTSSSMGSASSVNSMSASLSTLPSSNSTYGSLTTVDNAENGAGAAASTDSASAAGTAADATKQDAADATAATVATPSSTQASAAVRVSNANTSTAASVDATSGTPALVRPERTPSDDTIFIVRLAQRVAGWLTGLATAAFLMTYQWVVEPAPPGSLPVRVFPHLATGPLRPLLLAFYANASDFTRRLTSVRANGKFSNASPEDEWLVQEERLGDVVSSLKKQFGLDYVYCWHGLPAYWAGVMPDSIELAHLQAQIVCSEPTPGILEVEPSMAWNPAVLAGVGVIDEPQLLYEAMHSYLRSSGVDGVKVDCQAGVGLVGSAMGGGAALSQRFHTALEDSVMRNFDDNHCINCMCHSTENLYRMTNTSVARASDDFYPRDAASSHPHIAACAFNGLFMSALVQPDWDMFHSRHASAELHGMARAVSGGAVYVSDKPGEHNFELLRRLVLPDGSVLRALQPARPTRDSLFSDVLRDGVSVLKVWTVNAYCGLVGLFNLQGSSWDRTRRKFIEHDRKPKPLAAKVSAWDVESLVRDKPQQQQQKYALYSCSGQALRVLRQNEAMEVVVAGASGEMVTVSPVIEAAGVAFAPIGLCNMFNSGGAVRSCTAHADGLDASFTVGVRGNGRFLTYCSHPPSAVSAEHLTLHHSYDAATGAVHVEVPTTQDLTCQLTFTVRT